MNKTEARKLRASLLGMVQRLGRMYEKLGDEDGEDSVFAEIRLPLDQMNAAAQQAIDDIQEAYEI